MKIIKSNSFEDACRLAAEYLGISIQEFKRKVFEDQQDVYDREDVISWLTEQGYKFSEDHVNQILDTLRSKYDADLGTWGNIESAYYYNRMNLPYADDEDEEESDAE